MKLSPDSPYSSTEFIGEDGKLYVQFCNASDELVAKREIPQDCTIESYLAMFRQN